MGIDNNLLRGNAPDLTAGRPAAAPAPFPLLDDKLTCMFLSNITTFSADLQLTVVVSNADSAISNIW